MKKLIAAVLSLMLMLCAVTALGESAEKQTIGNVSVNGEFALQCAMPEGYKVVPVSSSPDQVLAVIQSEDPQAPVIMLSVAFDETYYDVDRLNDLDEEALELLEKTYIEDDEQVEITYGETGFGTRVLVAKHDTEDQDFISFLTIYKGYFVELVLLASQTAEDKNLTDEQIARCVEFLTDMDFIPGAARNENGSTAALAGESFTANLSAYNPAANTVQLELLQSVPVDPETVDALQVGDTLTVGDLSIRVETIDRAEEYPVINEEYSLRPWEDEFLLFFYEREIMAPIRSLTVEIPDTLVFVDEIDPDSGEVLDTPATETAADLRKLLEHTDGPDFASQNVTVTFDENGGLAKVERFHTPWQ